MIRIEIWASGEGSNAENIIRYFRKHSNIEIVRVSSNRPDAGALSRAESLGIETCVLSNPDFETGSYLDDLKKRKVDMIVLAGYLKLVPKDIVEHFDGRMLNIHPALLPEFGGKNMYGNHVHKAVIQSGVGESGITIHLVNEEFDKGEIIAQYRIPVAMDETLQSLQSKIQQLEQQYYPIVIEEFVTKNMLTKGS